MSGGCFLGYFGNTKAKLPSLFRTGRWVSFWVYFHLLCLEKDFANKKQWGTREGKKRPTACVRSVTECCGFQGSQLRCVHPHLHPPENHQGPAVCEPTPFPVLSAHTSHTYTHPRHSVSASFQLGPDPPSGRQMEGSIAFEGLEQHCWAAGSTPCLLTGVISQAAHKNKNSAAH